MLRRFTVKGGRFCLWIYAVPVSESCTRLIINAGGNFPKPKPEQGLAGLKARFSPQPLIRALLRQLRCMLPCAWHGVLHVRLLAAAVQVLLIESAAVAYIPAALACGCSIQERLLYVYGSCPFAWLGVLLELLRLRHNRNL